MDIRELKRRLAPFAATQRPADEDGGDLGGEVISVNGASTDNGWDSAPGDDEDRGDTFTPASEAAPPPAPAAAPAAPAAAPVAATPEPAPAPAAPAQAPAAAPAADGAAAPAAAPSAAVPHGRFHEVNEARKTAEARAETLQRELDALRLAQQQAAATPAAPAASTAAAPAAPAEPAFDVHAAEKEYVQHLMDGETDKAAELRNKINDHLTTTAATRALELQQAQAVQSTLQTVADKAVVDWPYLNTEAGADAMTMIVSLRDNHIRAGMSPANALQLAVDKIAPKFAPATTDTPTLELPAGEVKTDTRTQEAIARGLQASTTQAPALQAGIGNRASAATVDVENLTEEQFDALSEAEKAKLRGDTL